MTIICSFFHVRVPMGWFSNFSSEKTISFAGVLSRNLVEIKILRRGNHVPSNFQRMFAESNHFFFIRFNIEPFLKACMVSAKSLRRKIFWGGERGVERVRNRSCKLISLTAQYFPHSCEKASSCHVHKEGFFSWKARNRLKFDFRLWTDASIRLKNKSSHFPALIMNFGNFLLLFIHLYLQSGIPSPWPIK